jgi:mRNA interferase RelE/StbE
VDAYGLRLSPAACRTMERLPVGLAAAAARYMTGPLIANPYRVGKPLRNGFVGLNGARVGLYRIVYRIEEDHRLVRVTRIDHRADVYRQR